MFKENNINIFHFENCEKRNVWMNCIFLVTETNK